MGIYEDAVAEGLSDQPNDPFNPPRPKSRPWFDLEDMALAIPRGVIGAVKGAYNLADTLAVDSLPDWNSNPLGESKSVAGGWIEGAAHFTAGFLPFAGGALPLIGKFGGLLPTLAEGAGVAANVGRVAAASGLAGFTVFEGHEARLSDMVNKHAPLVGPVADFLSSNPDDPELLGRLKGAIEQAGLGAATEGIVLGIKAVAAGLAAKMALLNKGLPEAEAAAGAEKAAAAVATPEKVASAAYMAGGSVDEGVSLARDNAREYMARGNQEFWPPPPDEVKVDPKFAAEIADAYAAAKHMPDAPGVKESYELMKKETLDQFDFLVEKGVKMEPWAGKGEPYANSGAMRQDVRDNGHLWFLPTEASQIPADHPLAAPAGRSINGRELLHNDVFRAVHDYFGHAAEGNKFGPHGEEVAWQLHARMYSENARPAMTTETRGQNSWVNYNADLRAKMAAGQRVPLAERPFAEQKATILPAQFDEIRPNEEARLSLTGAHELPSNMRSRLGPKFDITEADRVQFSEDAAKAYPDLRPDQAIKRLAADENLVNMERRIVEGPAPQGVERRAPVETPRQRGARTRAEGATEAQIADSHLKAMGPESGGGGAQEPPKTGGAAGAAPEPLPEPAKVPLVNDTPERAMRIPYLRDLGLNDEQVAAFTRAFEEKRAVIEKATGDKIPNRNPRNMTAAERLEQGLLKTDLPMQNFRTPEAAYAMTRTIEDFFRSQVDEDFKAFGPRTMEQLQDEAAGQVADMLGYKNAKEYMVATQVRGGQTLKSLHDMNARVNSDRAILNLASKQLVNTWELLEKVRAGEVAGNQEKIAIQFGEALQHATAMDALVNGHKYEAGLLLRSFRNEVGGVNIPPELLRLADDPQHMQESLQSMGGMEQITKVMDKYKKAWELAGEGGGNAALAKLRRATYGRKFLDMTTEFFMGAVLSSPQTWVVNGSSNALAAFFLPIERAVGSMLIRGSNGKLAPAIDVALQSRVAQESLAEIGALKDSFVDTVRMMKDSGWEPEGAFARSGLADPGYRGGAITAQNLGLADDSVGAWAANWTGKAARAPMEILGGTDAVTKNVLFRAKATARLQTEALQAGLSELRAISEHVQARLGELIKDGQAYSQKSVIQRAVQSAKDAGLTSTDQIQQHVAAYYAKNYDTKLGALANDIRREVEFATYTNNPAPKTVTAGVMRFVNNHPLLKLVAPFIRTPSNLLKAAGQRADAPSVVRYMVGRVWPRAMPEMAETSSRFLQDMLSNDPRRAADAVGRIATGMAASTFFLHQAFSGNITGRGPADPNQRQALIDTGWQPYSFKVGDAYVSYQRLDPFATFIGTAADMAQYMNESQDVDDGEHDHALTGLAVGVANNFTNKSYLTGFANLVGALQAPDKKLPEFFNRQIASFVPNILGTAGYGIGQDPNLREVHTLVDSIMSKIPGLSDKLPPRRNILGEPLERPAAVEGKDPVLGTLVNLWDPIKYSRVKDDVVRNELATLGHSWDPPKRKTNGIDLMDVPLGKTNAYDRWQELQGTVTMGGMNLKDALRREIRSPGYQKLTAESVDGLESPRVGRLDRIINDYRAKSWTQLLKEKPALKQHDVAYTANKHRLRAGLPAAIIPGVQ